MNLVLALLLTAHTVSVSWSAPAEPVGFTISGYYIYRSIDGAAAKRVTSVTTTAWDDVNTYAGHSYCYSIAVKGTEKLPGMKQSSSLTSLPSDPACVTVQ